MRVEKKINVYIWCNKEQIYDYLAFFVKERKCNFEIIIWNKTNVPPFCSGHYIKDKEYCLYFWECGAYLHGTRGTMRTVIQSSMNVGDKELYLHPTIKPEPIISDLISNSSIAGDVVLDPFSGSGTTCAVAKRLGRHYLGFEINKQYYDISIARLRGDTADDTARQKAGQLTLF